MRVVILLLISAALFTACDDTRLYEKNFDFEDQFWPVNNKPEFEFDVTNVALPYNIYGNLRNSVSYPYSRLFVTYYLKDSLGNILQKKLIDHMLFDPKTGKPGGSSALGDIYDHQVPLIGSYKFKYPGKYKIMFEQFMRTDTLQGVLAVGVRVEKAVK